MRRVVPSSRLRSFVGAEEQIMHEKIQDIRQLNKELLEQNIYMGGRGFYQVVDETPLVGRKNLFFCVNLQENKRYLVEFAPPNLTHVELQKYLRRALFLMVLEPNNGIVTAKDFSIDPARSFVILDWVQGKNLNSILKHVRLTVRESLWILLDMANALNHLSDFTFVHRNIQPSNILIQDGTTRAYLQGVDYLTQSDFLQTQMDSNVQNAPYISPELMRYLLTPEKPVFITPASDVYSLGAVFYHMLSGEPPFAKRTNMGKWALRPGTPKLKMKFADRRQKGCCRTLLKRMMAPSFHKRWTAYEVRACLLDYLDKSHRSEDMERWTSE